MIDLRDPSARTEEEKKLWPAPKPLFKSPFVFPIDTDKDLSRTGALVVNGLAESWRDSSADEIGRGMTAEGAAILNHYATLDQDQMNRVFNLIGTPTLEDIKKRNYDPLAQHYLTLFKSRPPSFEAAFSKADGDFIDLISRVMRFVPSERLGVREMIDHKYFDDVRHLRTVPEAQEAKEVAFSSFDSSPSDQMVRQALQNVIKKFSSAGEASSSSSSSAVPVDPRGSDQ